MSIGVYSSYNDNTMVSGNHHAFDPLQGKSNVKWAMAARSEAKLEKLRSDLAKINPAMKVATTAASPQLAEALTKSPNFTVVP